MMDSNIPGEEALADDFGGMGLVGSHPGRGGGLRSRGRAGDRRIGGRDPRRTAHGNHGGDFEGLDMGQGFLAFNRPLPVRHMGGEGRGGPQSTHGTGTQPGRGGSRGPMSHQEGPAIVENQVFGPPEPEQGGHGPNSETPERGGQRQGGQPQEGGGRHTFTAHRRDERYQMSNTRARAAIDQHVSTLVSRLRDRSIDPTEFEDRLDMVLDRFAYGGGAGGPMAAPINTGYQGGYGPHGPVPVGHRHTPRYRTRELDNGCAIM